MQITYIYIKNYRGLDIEIKDIKKVSIIIGHNDSGKTNICSAILKVLDYNNRRRPFTITDSTNSNKDDIIIELELSADDLSNEQLALVGNYIHKCEEKKYIRAKLISKYNEETMEYEDTLLYGDSQMDYQEVKPNVQTQLDKILSIIYVDPLYDIEQSKKDFFKYKEIFNKENEIFFSADVSENIERLNEGIQSEPIVAGIQEEINEKGEFTELFDSMFFKVVPNMKSENIYKSLNIIAFDEDNNEFENIGDGKNKIFSMILKSKIFNQGKKKIFIIEEPENHLYVLLQRVYISALLKMNPDQLFITTHSPYTIDFEKTNQIIKITYNKDDKKRKIYKFNDINNEDFKKFGYLINVEVGEMLYYDNVLLIEGASEKYFYSLLMSRDISFCKEINKKRFGIYAVDGVAFETIKILLEKLGINVFIKTDNDIFKVPRKQQWRYAGLERCVEYISEESRLELKSLLGIESEKFEFRIDSEEERLESIEKNIEKIIDILYKDKVIFSKHNLGFEGDFIEYIKEGGNDVTEEIIDYLKQAKLKNLHYFIDEYNIDIKVNENNKRNVLVRFLYE